MKLLADFVAGTGSEAASLEHCAAINEALSPGLAEGAAVAILLRLSQLKQRVVQDRNATAAQKELSSMLQWLAGLVAVGIGVVSNDSGLVSRAGRRSRDKPGRIPL